MIVRSSSRSSSVSIIHRRCCATHTHNMPALRIDTCPQYTVVGCVTRRRRLRDRDATNHNHNNNNTRRWLLLSWMADDDLRGWTKYSILLRVVQLLILGPTLCVLIMTQVNAKDLYSNNNNNISTTTTTTILPCRLRQSFLVIWFFWSSSLLTTLSFLVLDIYM